MYREMTHLAIQTSGRPAGPSAVDVHARGLLDALRRSPSSLDPSIEPGFDRLLREVESLSLDSHEFAIVHHWILGARDLWEQGEPLAALYQVKLACKRLQGVRPGLTICGGGG